MKEQTITSVNVNPVVSDDKTSIFERCFNLYVFAAYNHIIYLDGKYDRIFFQIFSSSVLSNIK